MMADNSFWWVLSAWFKRTVQSTLIADTIPDKAGANIISAVCCQRSCSPSGSASNQPIYSQVRIHIMQNTSPYTLKYIRLPKKEPPVVLVQYRRHYREFPVPRCIHMFPRKTIHDDQYGIFGWLCDRDQRNRLVWIKPSLWLLNQLTLQFFFARCLVASLLPAAENPSVGLPGGPESSIQAMVLEACPFPGMKFVEVRASAAAAPQQPGQQPKTPQSQFPPKLCPLLVPKNLWFYQGKYILEISAILKHHLDCICFPTRP